MKTLKPTKIVIADGSETFSTALAAILKQHGAVVCQASEEADYLRIIKAQKPDIFVYDFRLTEDPFEGVIKAIRKASPKSRLVVLSYNATLDMAEYCICCGADGFCDKSLTNMPLILDTINKIAAGEQPLLIPVEAKAS